MVGGEEDQKCYGCFGVGSFFGRTCSRNDGQKFWFSFFFLFFLYYFFHSFSFSKETAIFSNVSQAQNIKKSSLKLSDLLIEKRMGICAGIL